MARHSYVEFRERLEWVRDGALVVLVESLLAWGEHRKDDACGDWLCVVCRQWLSHFDAMPPGLKAVELDAHIGSEEQLECLKAALHDVKLSAVSQGPEFLPGVCDQWLTVLGEQPNSFPRGAG